jgi:hypothetical protein
MSLHTVDLSIATTLGLIKSGRSVSLKVVTNEKGEAVGDVLTIIC